MPFTNIAMLREHLATHEPVTARVTDQPVTVRTGQWVIFYDGAVVEDSLVVKQVQAGPLIRSSITLSDEAVLLSASPICPGSLVVASDSSLTTIYYEHGDYLCDPATATLYRKTDGNLDIGQPLIVWYRSYVLYQDGVDYDVDIFTGRLRARSGGQLSDHETVLIDYTSAVADWAEASLQTAVDEANGLIEARIDSRRDFGAAPGLSTAATYLALAIVCRMLAARELVRSSQEKTSAAWLKLSAEYASHSEALLQAFLPPHTPPSGPVLR